MGDEKREFASKCAYLSKVTPDHGSNFVAPEVRFHDWFLAPLDDLDLDWDAAAELDNPAPTAPAELAPEPDVVDPEPEAGSAASSTGAVSPTAMSAMASSPAASSPTAASTAFMAGSTGTTVPAGLAALAGVAAMVRKAPRANVVFAVASLALVMGIPGVFAIAVSQQYRADPAGVTQAGPVSDEPPTASSLAVHGEPVPTAGPQAAGPPVAPGTDDEETTHHSTSDDGSRAGGDTGAPPATGPGSGSSPSPSPSPSPSQSPSASPSPDPEPSPDPDPSPSEEPDPEPSPDPTDSCDLPIVCG